MAGGVPVILLDTNVLLFLFREPERISKVAMDALESARPGELLISSVSAWEVAMLSAKKRIELPLPPREWFQLAIKEFGIRDIVLDTASSARALELPAIHQDPCDRWILATAVTFGIPIMSADGVFAKYNLVPVIW